ncbi:MAG: glycogen debranching enzyme family protein [Planctomycetes bacterium]|nr:glycogen debranching enzyme family protein [Planctomycetota bacterium]MBI3844823.1 glycogen debranching enzyme family protein [Planctomycetota bacterium]
MNDLVRSLPGPGKRGGDLDTLFAQEWLVTNGLGGYAAGTVYGINTRRYHGLLIAALPTPHGRVLMLSHLRERVRFGDRKHVTISTQEYATRPLDVESLNVLSEFRLENGLPVWRYDVRGIVFEKRVLLVYRQNTVHVQYRVLSGDEPLRLSVRPSVHFRFHEASVTEPTQGPYSLTMNEDRYELRGGGNFPPLRFQVHGERAEFTVKVKEVKDVFYRVEQRRGYESTGVLWSPGYFRVDLKPGGAATLVASTESWDTIAALSTVDAVTSEQDRRRRLIAAAHPSAREGPFAELILASDQFIVRPAGRIEDTARAQATGDELCSVIAGYHWFTDWGRDTMISLEGLTLATGRFVEAGYILRTFSRYVRDGLIPNLFPEGRREGVYYTADATLWYFHAIQRYIESTADRLTLRILLPKLLDIIDHHLRGTQFGIGVDPKDGLLRQGDAGHPLTWMDAKVEDWIPTPRRGKAVEINALWYNALRLAESWVKEERGAAAARPIGEHADRVQQSFNQRFWNAQRGYLYDVVDGEHGDDAACRPNQVFALSLDHPVLEPSRWRSVLDVVREHLLTPVGLRTLAPGSPDYQAKYFGDRRARDAAYHQGTVWAWLIGPFIDAWLRVHPDDRAGARKMLESFVPHFGEACIGSINEVFDAEEPLIPRGCVAQAWSVAEVLRCWVKTVAPGNAGSSRG